jgi:uncharacterized protein (TIGR03086 family)
MSEEIEERFTRTVQDFATTLAGVRDEQWGDPTPCTDWDVRALVNHVTSELAWVTPLVSGQTIADVGDRFDGDLLGADPVEAYNRAATDAVDSVTAPGALQGHVELSYGRDTTASYADQIALDCLIHRWDLARGVGAPDALPDDLVEWALAYVTPMKDRLSASGSYGTQIDVPPEAPPQTRLLAMLGRVG